MITSLLITVICSLLSNISYFGQKCKSDLPLDISDYKYPKPADNTSDTYTIAIFSTNDIHGSAFSFELNHPITNETYEYGGLDYLGTYINILKQEWKDKFLWLDGGDQFQGALESKLSNGSIMTDFFNYYHVNGSAIGNHEFDNGINFLDDRLNSANWNYLASNIINDKNQTEFLPNTKNVKLFQVGDIKVGVIGLSTIETPYTTSGNLTNINFLDYKDIIVYLSKILRDVGADTVILNSHIGLKCDCNKQEKLKLKIWDITIPQCECVKENEMNKLLNSLDYGIIDAVVGGHVHNVVHNWINGIPVVQSVNGGYYSHVMYLTFNMTTRELIRDKILIEGPMPTCGKVFENNRLCEYVSKSESTQSGKLTQFKYHGTLMQKDPHIDTIFLKWLNEIKNYQKQIAYTEGLLSGGCENENTLGNLASDAIKYFTNSDISIMNDGTFRSIWFPGKISEYNLFNMFPFDNLIVSFDMTGEELKRMMRTIQMGDKGFYHSSGLLQNVTANPHSLVDISLYDWEEIKDDKIFKVATSEFLIKGGDDFKDVVPWYTVKNYVIHSDMRQMITDYISLIQYIPENGFIDERHRRLNVIK